MLATDLSNAEIVLGKIGVRLVPVIGLIACVLPVAALGGLLGGIDPLALLGSFVTAIACAVLGCSLALTLSVWGRKTHEVLMITYLILILWVISSRTDAHRGVFVSVTSRSSSHYRLDRLGMDRVLEPILPCLCSLFGSRQGGSDDLSGFPGIVSLSVGLALGPGNEPDSRCGVETGRAVRWRRLATGTFARRFRRPKWLTPLPGPSLDGNPVFGASGTVPGRRGCCAWSGYSIRPWGSLDCTARCTGDPNPGKPRNCSQ